MVRNLFLGIIYCVFNSFDECDETSLELFFIKFAALFSININENLVCYFKVIVVSRDLFSFILNIFLEFFCICLDSDGDTEVSDNIYRFIKEKIEELCVFRNYLKKLGVYVKKIFKDRAQGIFFWVEIVVKALKKYKLTEVAEALNLFLLGLDELYIRMLL